MAGEYSWLNVNSGTTLTASGGFAAQTTALTNGLTDPAHTFSSSTGFTVPAGRYIVGVQVSWNSVLSTSRWMYAYDSTNTVKYMHAYEDQVYMNSVTGVLQAFTLGIELSGSAAIGPAFYVASTTAADRQIETNTLTRLMIYRID
jgi:hypothetical protein